ncbi:hypothetical protein PSH91_07185 [Pseudomonas sp. FP1154]|jgi:hypothetical protein|uniref:hypothetical protein n=1 Tax=unclassified Pseudomonas TaxID=196821 RepID=UPI00166146F0|nr:MULTISPECIES: hypothetical protein [unclassified Pseudomonas]MDR8387332.1 hypothetical protein [Pseudomonas sp. JL2]WLG24540.1 hypothetical protein PSH91_07185 [Pseudomonas sp. FP1154]
MCSTPVRKYDDVVSAVATIPRLYLADAGFCFAQQNLHRAGALTHERFQPYQRFEKQPQIVHSALRKKP